MPDFTRLKSVLLTSGLQHQNPSLYQVIDQLLTFIGNVPGSDVATAISNTSGSGPAGPAGANGATGATGLMGLPGIDGIDGDIGSQLIQLPTTHQLLDLIASNPAVGSILYRDTNLWKLLAPGTSNYFLQTLGNGSPPAWAQVTDSPQRSSLQFGMFVSAGGALVCDGPFNGAGTITGTTNAKPTSAFSDGFYWNAATSTTAASAATYVPSTSGTGPINFTWDFDISLVMRTDISAVTGVRYWFIIGAASAPGNVDTLPSNGIAVRFSTVASDAGWVGVTFDGTQAVTASINSVAANTKYIIRIRKVGSTVFFSVNGGAEVSTSTHVPVNDAYATPVCAVYNTAGGVGSARSFYFSRCFGNIGS